MKWLNDNQKSFEALRQGSQKAYYWPIYETQKARTIQNILIWHPTRPSYKYGVIARGMGWQIIYDAYNGKVRDALNNCLVLQKFGMHLQGKGFLVQQITGVFIEGRAYQKTFMLLQKQDIPVDELRNFYNN